MKHAIIYSNLVQTMRSPKKNEEMYNEAIVDFRQFEKDFAEYADYLQWGKYS